MSGSLRHRLAIRIPHVETLIDTRLWGAVTKALARPWLAGYNPKRCRLDSSVGGWVAMTSPGSVTGWIDRARQGDSQAAGQLWHRYFHELVKLARSALKHAPRRAVDEEDVALSAFDSFCRGAEQGRFPDLNDRANLWRLLVVLTRRKAAHLIRDERRQKRGGGAVLDQAALAGAPMTRRKLISTGSSRKIPLRRLRPK
jgi:hypothetical protein